MMPGEAPRLVFKIEVADTWHAAARDGRYDGAAIDHRDGFIHLSAADQVAGTLAAYFAGRADLVLIAVDVERCGAALKWEVSRDGALFPHLYGTLPMDAVVGAAPIGVDGTLPNAQRWGLPR